MSEQQTKTDGGPAFPHCHEDTGHPRYSVSSGMSLRDWIAGHVDLDGYVFPDADLAARVLGVEPPFDDTPEELMRFGIRLQAALRYALADAMLKARSQAKDQQP